MEHVGTLQISHDCTRTLGVRIYSITFTSVGVKEPASGRRRCRGDIALLRLLEALVADPDVRVHAFEQLYDEGCALIPHFILSEADAAIYGLRSVGDRRLVERAQYSSPTSPVGRSGSTECEASRGGCRRTLPAGACMPTVWKSSYRACSPTSSAGLPSSLHRPSGLCVSGMSVPVLRPAQPASGSLEGRDSLVRNMGGTSS